MKKTILLACALVIGIPLAAQTSSVDSCFQVWNKPYATAEEIVKTYKASDNPSVVDNCCMIWHAGNYILNGKGEQQDISLLLASFPSVDLTQAEVLAFMQRRDVGVKKYVNAYFLLQGMKKGYTFDASRDGLSFTTVFRFRAPSVNDYEKLEYIFSTTNATLHKPFLSVLDFVLMNNGLTVGLQPIQRLIEKNVAEGALKQKVLTAFRKAEGLKAGQPAPLSVLKDAVGKEHTFAELKGKIVMVDVWATWCSSCLKKMPLFVALEEEYAHRDDIIFVFLSTDRNKALGAWQKQMDKYQDKNIRMWRADVEGGSSFETDYNIFGLPRYIIIDAKGNLVEAYAPSPDGNLKQLIEETLKTTTKK